MTIGQFEVAVKNLPKNTPINIAVGIKAENGNVVYILATGTSIVDGNLLIANFESLGI